MKYYGLVATGCLIACEGSEKIICRKIFSSMEKATNYIETFKTLCGPSGTGTAKLSDLDPDSIRVHIIELKLDD